ncbi:MAG: hypothetical protein ACT4OU_06600 [Hyphomicrobium sp.]
MAFLKGLGTALIIACGSHAASAATGSVPFTGAVLSTCAITIGTPGIMTPNGDFTVLSSANAGGLSGAAAVLATGPTFHVSAGAPSAFVTAPPTGNDNATFAASYRGTGATTVGVTAGAIATALNVGVTNVEVDLTATKSSGVFATGAYASEVLVTCEPGIN